SAGHARVLAGLDDNARKLALAKETIEQGYSVRQLEALAAAAKAEPEKQPAPKPKKAALPAELTELESRIRETMGVRATLTGTVKKGKIVLQYYSQDELEHLNDLLLRLEE
ncbi:MAG: stage 0 sporulation protein J, partial [Clostridia bacterium]|nr:stage 0 sporulation protein J [Clostridia bacterium]